MAGEGGEFTAEDFGEEVAVAAGGFEEAGIDALALVGYEVAHVVHQREGGKDVTVVHDSLAGFHSEYDTGKGEV